tara:strand:- start:75 stop:593 length:519 start_codon:yes stop_codon:yes gene_type:complete
MSEEANEKKNKITKTARVFGFLAVLSVLGVVGFILFVVQEWFSLSHTRGYRNLYWDWIAGIIIVVSLIFAIARGVKTAKRWREFKRVKKILLGVLIIIPIIPLVPGASYVLKERLFNNPDYELEKGYTIHVRTINDKDLSGIFVKMNKSFLILKGETGYIHIPKDKIHYIEK